MLPEVVLVTATIEGDGFCDATFFHELGETLVHGLHPVSRTGLHQRVDLVCLRCSGSGS